MWPWKSSNPPYGLRIRSSVPFIVTTSSFAIFTDLFLYGVLVPVLPFALTNRMGVDKSKDQLWSSVSLAVYGASLAVSSFFWGMLASRVRNRRIPMLSGLIFLLGATLLLCFSTNIASLLVGRVLQAVSGGLAWTVSLALVVDTVDPQNLGKALGWLGAAASLGILVAPLLGGVVNGARGGGYYPVFAMCFGLLAVDIVMRLLVVEAREAAKWLGDEEQQTAEEARQQADVEKGAPLKKEDVDVDPETKADVGTNVEPAAEVAGTEAVTVETGRGQDADASTKVENETPKVAPTSSTSRVPNSGSGSKSMTSRLRILRKPRLLAALWGSLAQALLTTAFDSTLPLLVSSTFGWSSVGGGLIFLPFLLPSFLSPVVGAISDRYGSKWLCTCGFFLAVPFLVCLRFVTEDTIQHKVMLCGLLFGTGVSLAMVFGPLMAEITWSVVEDRPDGAGEQTEEEGDEAKSLYALSYGLYTTVWSLGALLGPIMGGLIRDRAGFGTAGWSLAIVMGVTAVTQALWLGGPLRSKKSSTA